MAILKTDIKLMASERMHDEEDGGGRMSGNEIVDGLSNSMFPDVSQLDRTYGRINLRKTFEAVLSDNVDTFFGSNIIISKPPSDDTIHTTLFRTTYGDEGWVDERTDAQDKMESYITIGQLSSMVLIGTQYEGQRALLAYQSLTAELPTAGEVYALYDTSNENTQYVRVTSVEASEQEYVADDRTFYKMEITLGISDPLDAEFVGGVVTESTNYQPESELHKTNSVPAVSYYGIQTLAEPAEFDAREVKVSSYKGNLLPSTQTEEGLLDVPAGNGREHTINAGTRDVTISQIESTTSLLITAGNRSYTYVAQIIPKPGPGTLEISYRAVEKWYKIVDELGTGELSGDGVGVVNYDTGSVSMTLQEMPDAETRIIIGWGSSNYIEEHSDAVVSPFMYRYTCATAQIKPSTVTITWYASAVEKTLTDNGFGLLTGDGTGNIDYSSGELFFVPTILPDPGETPQITYTELEEEAEEAASFVYDPVTGDCTITLSAEPVPGSVKITYRALLDLSVYPHNVRVWIESQIVKSDQWQYIAGMGVYVQYIDDYLQVKVTDDGSGNMPNGSINYATHEVIVSGKILLGYDQWVPSGSYSY